MPVGLDLVDEHGALLAAVPGQVALPVAVDVEPADHLRPVDRALPDAGVDGPAAPGDVLRHPDVDRESRVAHFDWISPILIIALG